mgnify:CR=1 FL=1
MKEKGEKFIPDPRELPLLEKRGICIYIQDVFIIAPTLMSVFDIIEKERKIFPQETTKIMKEVASYIYFETVKQISEYHEEDLPENDVRRVLDVISSYFYYSYHIDNLPEKVEEYRRAENPIEQASRNILKIVRRNSIDTEELFEISTTIADITIHTLFDGIRRMFKLSENEVGELIEDFFVNYYPKFIEGE